MGKIFQVLGTAIICNTCLNMGIGFTWPAFTMLLFDSDNTPLNRRMAETELALLGSLSSIGAVISTMAAGFLLDRIGRKYCCMAGALCMVAFWFILVVSRRVEAILAAVFMCGLGYSGILIASVYVGEICQETIRGSMSAAILTMNNLGFVVSYLMGGYLDYTTRTYVGLSMAVSSVIQLFFIKDSPIYLMRKGKDEEVAQSLAFYRRLKPNDPQITEEIISIKRLLNAPADSASPKELSSELDKLNPESGSPSKKLSFFQFIKRSKATRRALFVVMMLFTAGIFQGQVVVLVFAEPLFSAAVPSLSPAVASVISASVVVVSSSISAYLTDIAGRRPLMIFGSLSAAVSCLGLGTQLHLHWGPSWLTAIFMYMFPITFTIGAGTVPMVLVAEAFLPEVKSILSMLAVEWMWACNFALLFLITPVLKAIGWGPVFYIFGTVCFSTAVFAFFFVPETKGLTVEEIQPLFYKKKIRNNL